MTPLGEPLVGEATGSALRGYQQGSASTFYLKTGGGKEKSKIKEDIRDGLEG